MSNTPHSLALAALRHWAAVASGGIAPPVGADPVLLQRSAWLLTGVAAPADQPWPQPPAEPLASIFRRIKGQDQAAPNAILVPQALRLEKSVLFPTTTPSAYDPRAVSDELHTALAELAQRKLPAEAEVEGLLYALQRYAWALPSPLEAVSLYDFARSHAALVAALAADPTGEVCLVGGDLSGVQEFIYSVSARGATRQLRGRSLYLQLLTDACAHAVLTTAGMPLCNLLYAGGGRFYVLVPTTIDGLAVEAWLATQRRYLDRFFLNVHQAELYLALGATRISQAELLRQTDTAESTTKTAFQQAWRRATEAINRAKRRRFADLGSDFAEVFAPEGHNGNTEHICAICDFQGAGEYFAPPQPPEPRRCKLCDSFEDLGRLLHNATQIVMHQLDLAAPLPVPVPGRRAWQQCLSYLGLQVQLNGPATRPGAHDNLPPRQPVCFTRILDLNNQALEEPDTELLAQLRITGPWVRGLRPLANTTPMITQADKDTYKCEPDEQQLEEDKVKPFNVMVAQSRGVKRLGVLRMDVDDLGDIFLNQLDAGLAGVAALSAALSRFFEGWVGVLCDRMNAPKSRIERGVTGLNNQGSVYCIYSGGDDLFIVGSWHLLPTLACWISEDLAQYSGEHPKIHVSAGISLHTAKFPLYRAAEEAEEELKRAKAREGKTAAGEPEYKAALGMLDQVVAWKAMPELSRLTQELDDYLTAKQPAALLQTLQQLYVQYVETIDPERISKSRRRQRTGQPAFGPWMWRGAYQLKRVEDSLRGEDKQAHQLMVKKLRKGLNDFTNLEAPVNEGARHIERYGLAARWAQLLHRSEKEERNGSGE
jgi:CRISPR-associated protein Csm1